MLSRFLDGGIDTVITEYLSYLSETGNYQITLAISLSMGKLEVFRHRIPERVKVVYIVDSRWLTKFKQRRVYRKIPLYHKLYDETALAVIRRTLIHKKISSMAAQYDAVIDFDCCHYSYLKNIVANKIAFFHFSFKQYAGSSPRRMRRIASHLNNYNHIVTISEAMFHEATEMFPDIKDKFVLIYNAKDPAYIHAKANAEVADSKIGENFILAVERLEESQKDITTLLHAYKILKEKWQHKERLFIIGKGQSESELRQLCTKLGIEDDVEFIGFTTNPYPWINRCKVMVHSSKFEGLPTAMIEGIMLGKPIVSSNCPTGPAEILEGGQAGILVDVGDSESMAEAIHKVLSDSKLAETLGKAALRRSEMFTFAHTVKIFDSLL